MSLHDEDVTVVGNDHVVWLIQLARASRFVPVTCLTSSADRQQRLPVSVHLDDDMAANVGGPEVAFPIDAQPMRAGEQLVAKRTYECAVAIELEECLVAARQHEKMPLLIEGNACGRPHRHPGWQGDRSGCHDVIEFGCTLGNEQRRVRRPLRQNGRDEHKHSEDNEHSLHEILRDWRSLNVIHSSRPEIRESGRRCDSDRRRLRAPSIGRPRALSARLGQSHDDVVGKAEPRPASTPGPCARCSCWVPQTCIYKGNERYERHNRVH